MVQVSIKQVPTKPVFEPVEITLRFETKEDLLSFKHVVGCWLPLGRETCSDKERASAQAQRIYGVVLSFCRVRGF